MVMVVSLNVKIKRMRPRRRREILFYELLVNRVWGAPPWGGPISPQTPFFSSYLIGRGRLSLLPYGFCLPNVNLMFDLFFVTFVQRR